MNFEIATRCIAASAGQDRVFVRVFDDVAVVALADGSGGRAGGDVAAQILVSQVSKIAQNVSDPQDEEFWISWMKKIDTLVLENEWAGETTAIVAVVGSGYVSGASVGDSSAWLIENHKYLDLTKNQVRRPFIGSGLAQPRSFGIKSSNGVLLLGSDGLTKYADAERLQDIVRNNDLEVAADRLIEVVRLPSGSYFDDVSCILSRVQGNKEPQMKRPKKRLRLNWFWSSASVWSIRTSSLPTITDPPNLPASIIRKENRAIGRDLHIDRAAPGVAVLEIAGYEVGD
jgi:serine/threonine protein phosphatase PrpC